MNLLIFIVLLILGFLLYKLIKKVRAKGGLKNYIQSFSNGTPQRRGSIRSNSRIMASQNRDSGASPKLFSNLLASQRMMRI